MKGDRILEIRHLSKTFGTNPVLKDIDFSVSSGGCDLHHRRVGFRKIHTAQMSESFGNAYHRRNYVPWNQYCR